MCSNNDYGISHAISQNSAFHCMNKLFETCVHQNVPLPCTMVHIGAGIGIEAIIGMLLFCPKGFSSIDVLTTSEECAEYGQKTVDTLQRNFQIGDSTSLMKFTQFNKSADICDQQSRVKASVMNATVVFFSSELTAKDTTMFLQSMFHRTSVGSSYIILTFDSTIIEKFYSQQKETHDFREVEVCKCLFVGTGEWANAHIFTVKRTIGAQKRGLKRKLLVGGLQDESVFPSMNYFAMEKVWVKDFISASIPSYGVCQVKSLFSVSTFLFKEITTFLESADAVTESECMPVNSGLDDVQRRIFDERSSIFELEEVKVFKASVMSILQGLHLMEGKDSQFYMLLSLPGAEDQQLHYDYPILDLLEHLKTQVESGSFVDKAPLMIWIGVSGRTFVRTADGVFEFDVGDALLLSGLKLHGGVRAFSQNIRFLVVVQDKVSFELSKNTVWFDTVAEVEKMWKPLPCNQFPEWISLFKKRGDFEISSVRSKTKSIVPEYRIPKCKGFLKTDIGNELRQLSRQGLFMNLSDVILRFITWLEEHRTGLVKDWGYLNRTNGTLRIDTIPPNNLFDGLSNEQYMFASSALSLTFWDENCIIPAVQDLKIVLPHILCAIKSNLPECDGSIIKWDDFIFDQLTILAHNRDSQENLPHHRDHERFGDVVVVLNVGGSADLELVTLAKKDDGYFAGKVYLEHGSVYCLMGDARLNMSHGIIFDELSGFRTSLVFRFTHKSTLNNWLKHPGDFLSGNCFSQRCSGKSFDKSLLLEIFESCLGLSSDDIHHVHGPELFQFWRTLTAKYTFSTG